MKKYFLYELKKARGQLIIFTAIFTIVIGTIAGVMPMQTRYDYYGEGEVSVVTNSPLISVMASIMCFTCFVAPVLVYAFKMNKRSVDCYYALPLKKSKLYLVKTLIGLLLVLIPFTVAFWVTFLIFLIRPNNPYQMVWFVPAYFGLIFFAVCLYGYNAFAFTRANSTVDGIVYMIGYQSVLFMVILLPYLWSQGELFSWEYLLDFIPGWGATCFATQMDKMAIASDSTAVVSISAMTFIMPLVRALAGYGLLFFLLKYDKAEDAQQVSESWLGYKTLIPIFTATIIGLFVGMLLEVSLSVSVVIFVMLAVAAFVLIIVWRRKFVFGKTGWIVLGAGLSAAIVLAVITALVL